MVSSTLVIVNQNRQNGIDRWRHPKNNLNSSYFFNFEFKSKYKITHTGENSIRRVGISLIVSSHFVNIKIINLGIFVFNNGHNQI